MFIRSVFLGITQWQFQRDLLSLVLLTFGGVFLGSGSLRVWGGGLGAQNPIYHNICVPDSA